MDVICVVMGVEYCVHVRYICIDELQADLGWRVH
jgi:hypothetical protein